MRIVKPLIISLSLVILLPGTSYVSSSAALGGNRLMLQRTEDH